jgi:hypothetical protein
MRVHNACFGLVLWAMLLFGLGTVYDVHGLLVASAACVGLALIGLTVLFVRNAGWPSFSRCTGARLRHDRFERGYYLAGARFQKEGAPCGVPTSAVN